MQASLPKQPRVITSIGVPGSGKTTALKEIAEKKNYSYICPDDIRAELSGNAADQTQNAKVWAIAFDRLRKEILAGHSVVFDATHAKKGDRLAFTAFCRAHDCPVTGIWFKTPDAIVLQRNKERKRVVSEFAIGRMAGWLEAFPPKKADGFDQLIAFNSQKQTLESLLARV